MRPLYTIVTSEHGGNQVPPDYNDLFKMHSERLATHEGYDIGSLDLAKKIAKASADENYLATTSRLLIELNRSLHHPKLFSSITGDLPDTEKEKIIKNYYAPHRNGIENAIKQAVDKKYLVIHLAIHSFTPVLKGEYRHTDIGFLYDPKRAIECLFSRAWQAQLKQHAPEFRVRFNYPYRGTADGLTTYLRRRFPKHYAGLEVEVNQRFFTAPYEGRAEVEEAILASLKAVLTKPELFTKP